MKSFLWFLTGVAVGGFVAYRVAKSQQQQVEEIEVNVSDVPQDDYILVKTGSKPKEINNEEKELPDLKETTSIDSEEIKSEFKDYTKCVSEYDSKKEKEKKDKENFGRSGIYKIEPEDYDLYESEYAGEYECVTWIYCSDGVVLDEYKEPVSIDIAEERVGRAIVYLETHPEEEDIYVRNDILETKYCIIRDAEPYSLSIYRKE